MNPNTIRDKSDPIKRRMLQQKGKNNKLKRNTLLKRETLYSYQFKQPTAYEKAVSGRNPLVVTITLFQMMFKFSIGIFDEVSDWVYYSEQKKNGSFANIYIDRAMTFFLIAQFFIQIVAWSIIFGKLKLNDKRIRNNKDPLIDIDDKTKNETSFFVWLFKFGYYKLRNFLTFLWASLQTLHYSTIMMILQETKISPFIIHYYFQRNYKVVLTQGLMQNMTVETKKQQMQQKERELELKMNKEKGLKSSMTLLEMYEEEQVQQQKNQRQLMKEIQLDANLESNLATFLFEADLEKYLRMADTIEAIFEALPLSILQYLNNSMQPTDQWSTFNIITFSSSVFTIMLYCISLIKYLFEEDAETLYSQWIKMNEIKKEKNQYLYDLYPLPEKIDIVNKAELLKLQHSNPYGIEKVKNLTIGLQESSNDAGTIIGSLEQLYPKTQCIRLNLRLKDCNMNFNQFEKLMKNSTYLKCDTYIMDVQDNSQMLHTALRYEQVQQIQSGQAHVDFKNSDEQSTIKNVKSVGKSFQLLRISQFHLLFRI